MPVCAVAAIAAGVLALAGRLPAAAGSLAAVLAGGLLLAGPAWVGRPPPPVPPPEPGHAVPGVTVSPDGLRTERAPARAAAPGPPAAREAARLSIEAEEVEPNDTLAAANRVEPGSAIDGTLAAGDRDAFRVVFGEAVRGDLVANVMVEAADVALTLLDDAGRALGTASTYQQIRVRSVSLERQVEGPALYVLVQPLDAGPFAYHLTVAVRPR